MSLTTRHSPDLRVATASAHIRCRGSVLVVALMTAALVALVLGSYLSLNLGTARLAQRTFNRGAAFHLAEAGLEEGLWTYNRLLAGAPDAWTGWTVSEDAAWRRLDGFALAAATSGTVKIYASPIAPDANARPVLVALASVQSADGAPVSQMIETTLSRRSFFASGLVARERLVFRGRNTLFNSWDSDPDRDPATPAVPFDSTLATDTGTVATGASDGADLALNHARIHGYFLSSGLEPDVGSGGFIGPFGVAEGVVDSTRFSRNFHADFPAVVAPADGEWIDTFGSTLGGAGTASSWRAQSLVLKGKDTLTVLGNVTLVLTAPIDAISVSGKASIIVPEGSSLVIYAAGDVSIGGQGVANANAAPAALQIWSTASPGGRVQAYDIVGQGSFSGVLYAPEAAITVNGNGAVAGAVVARELTFTGNAAFHYDLALARLVRHAPYRVDGWRTVDDPAARAARLPLVDR